MSAVAHLFAAIVVTMLAESGAALDLLPVWTGLLWPFGAYLLAARVVARPDGRVAVRLLGVWPVLAHAGAVGVSGWLAVGAHRAEGLAGASVLHWPGPGLLLVLVPFVLAELATTDAAVNGDWRRRRASIAERSTVPTSVRRDAFLHGARILAALFIPLALYVLATTPLRTDPVRRAWIDGAFATDLAFTAGVALVLALALPRLFAFALGLRPLTADSPQNAGLLAIYGDVARHLGFTGGPPRLWTTGGREVNAAVIGFTARHRFVVVTDGIARVLDAGGARALFAHEMGHAVRRHPTLFATFSAAVLVPGLLLPELVLADAPTGPVGAWWLDWGLPLVSVVAWYLGFGWLSRRAELEADLVAVRAVGDAEPLIRLLARTSSPRRWRRDGWRHFAPARRAVFARAAQRHLEVGLRLERTLARARTWSRIVAGIALAVLLVRAVAGGAGGELPGASTDPDGHGTEPVRAAQPDRAEDAVREVDGRAIGPNDRARPA